MLFIMLINIMTFGIKALNITNKIKQTLRLKSEFCQALPLVKPGNTKGGSITVPLTSCWTGLESAV
jgi:hypothetical protein